MPVTTKIPFLLRVEPEVRELIRAASKKERRSMSNYVEGLVLKDLGIDPPDDQPQEIDIGFNP